MSLARTKRESKRQLGQFLTPIDIARKVVAGIEVNPDDIVLEPSFGKGAFVFAYMERIAALDVDIPQWVDGHFHGVEIDPEMFNAFKESWKDGVFPSTFVESDFFRYEMPSYRKSEYFSKVEGKYDLIIGNPPFGGTIASDIQDQLDSIYGTRNGFKIKKETYSFFIVKCLDMLKDGGRLVFICSDTMLSINTMSGLRKYLMNTCRISIDRIPGEFDETSQPMIVLALTKGGKGISAFGKELSPEQISRTPNSSWIVTDEFVRYFTGKTLGDFFVATSGMTIGKNEYFIREVDGDGCIEEPYDFELFDRPITLERELKNARLGKISPKKVEEIRKAELAGKVEPALRVTLKEHPVKIKLPHPDYAPYNKSSSGVVYSPTKNVVYWKNDGEAVYVFKKSGPWYLHGVGGKKFFKREGITWQLISSRLNIRYLPEGFILDTGCPVAFLKPGIDRNEMYFAMGWCLTKLCNDILKNVINHTRNIQSKDFERLPYPTWVDDGNRKSAIELVKGMIDRAMSGETFTHKSPEMSILDGLYSFQKQLTLQPDPNGV